MRTFLVILITLAINTLSFSQNYNSRVDSLLLKAQNAPDSMAAEAYNEVCKVLKYTNPVEAIKYSEKAAEIAKKTNNFKQESIAYNYIATCFQKLGKLSESMDYFHKGLIVAVEHDIEDQTAWNYRNLGNSFNTIRNFTKAIEYLNKSIEIGEKLKDPNLLLFSFNDISKSYCGKGDYKKALFYVRKALNIKNHNLSKLVYIFSKRIIAEIYFMQGNLDSSLYYTQECLNDKLIFTDHELTAEIYLQLSRIYFETENKKLAQHYCRKSIEYASKSNSQHILMNCYGLLGDIFYSSRNYEKAAINYTKQADYNDSILGNNLSGKLFNIQYKSEQFNKQKEINSINQDRQQQKRIISIVAAIIFMGITFSLIMIHNNRKIKKLNKKMDSQKEQITASITYARKIQQAVLPELKTISKVFSDKFVMYKPRDIVSGDFYWQHEDENFEMIAVGDCTGHGVPGACMSMLGASVLQEVAENTFEPNQILEKSREQIMSLLRQENKIDNQDGMSLALIVIEKKTRFLKYSGSYIPLVYIRNNEVKLLEGVRKPLGAHFNDEAYVTHSLQLQDNDILYLTTNGFLKQIGEKTMTKFGSKAFVKLLHKHHKLEMSQQAIKLEEEFESWRGNVMQLDDVCILGLKV